VLALKPTGYWPADEGGGTVLHDRSGNDNHGRLFNLSWEESGLLDYFCLGANPLWEARHPEQFHGEVEGNTWRIVLTGEYLDYFCASVRDALDHRMGQAKAAFHLRNLRNLRINRT
jgi:hypothetical protein